MDFGDKKVMVIDDSHTIRQIIMKNLKQAGFIDENIKESSDGVDALEKLCEERMDMIITNWNMPKMSGLEFLKRVRGKETLNGMPILMVTSVTEKAKILEAIKAGGSDYLIKPFNAVELQIKVRNLFQSHQTAV